MIDSFLLIGCGNIGGEYDFNSNQYLTHSKILNSSNWILNKYVFDKDLDKSLRIAKKYNFKIEQELNETTLNKHNIICIASPTDTHFNYLNLSLKLNTEFIICEKPISNSILEIDNLIRKYNNKESYILVNYFRRFQSGYKIIKENIKKLNIKPVSVKIIYSKGILNNATHALDLFQFITDKKIQPQKINIIKKEFDFFRNDPTVSAKFISNDILFELNGNDIKSKKFEMNISYNEYELSIKNRGDLVYLFKKNKLIKKWDKLICNYMIDVYKELESIITNRSDNFIESAILNKTIIKYFINE